MVVKIRGPAQPCDLSASLPIINVGAVPFDLGFVQYLVGDGLRGPPGGGGGLNGFFPFIAHGGWLPFEFFEAIGGPGGGSGILGVTFTFICGDNAPDGNFIPSDFEGFHGMDTGGHCSIWTTWPLK